MNPARILIIEDETLFAQAVAKRLEKAGHACTRAATLSEGLAQAAQQPLDLVLLDLRLPDGDGLERLPALLAGHPERTTPVIVMTAFGEVADAVRAMKLGATDYLKKPIDLEEMVLVVNSTLQGAGLRQQLAWSREREAHQADAVALLGESPAIEELRQQIRQLGKLAGPGTPGPTVLIQGETGSGKDVVARLLHQESTRRGEPFVHVDCSALPRDLIEAELFGHEKGAYTSAVQARTGLLEAAEHGTLFLDEIGELPLDLQAKLLTVIERRRLRRVGSVHERPVHARFVAASNRDLRRMVDEGAFRSDLYFRLNVLTLTLPPLRERGDDIVLLARHYAELTARRYRLPPPRFSDEVLAALCHYPWPGNVRELKHLTERAVLLSGEAPLSARLFALPEQASPSVAAGNGVPLTEAWPGVTLGDAEKTLIQQALAASGGNISEAARRLGITRMTLRYRMEKYRIRLEPDGA
ncbi:MAG: sigma-54-dependent Fis family transcriptional regulator [Betaproteobacteria bacterium]|nr:sigma-54-dependent Fis family transcriptional regulator [Betaproteobacteria bacterium]MDE2131684.1 sigma-54-dependent Fis family transcriptional regulator [Betaproteobacteria bacterium]MDE2212390.1 sigma-54-dependent Fis family transcriptional regulator [Betaproteobacteria bacterium]MDE2353394.1 sigma-54-dependent Fis family transcriptional regulator [Betaproteobacteria bacterium]MDE2625097.1 sigma-54-dependent Fis family transcriptional regulator [Betaproteobacteria bacterium]